MTEGKGLCTSICPVNVFRRKAPVRLLSLSIISPALLTAGIILFSSLSSKRPFSQLSAASEGEKRLDECALWADTLKLNLDTFFLWKPALPSKAWGGFLFSTDHNTTGCYPISSAGVFSLWLRHKRLTPRDCLLPDWAKFMLPSGHI